MSSQDQANNELNNEGRKKDVLPTVVSFREDTETLPTFILPEGHSSDDPSEVYRQFDIPSADFQESSLQHRRLSLFDYTPFSLPPSRVRFPPPHALTFTTPPFSYPCIAFLGTGSTFRCFCRAKHGSGVCSTNINLSWVQN